MFVKKNHILKKYYVRTTPSSLTKAHTVRILHQKSRTFPVHHSRVQLAPTRGNAVTIVVHFSRCQHNFVGNLIKLPRQFLSSPRLTVLSVVVVDSGRDMYLWMALCVSFVCRGVMIFVNGIQATGEGNNPS